MPTRPPARNVPPLGPLLITCARLLDEVAQAQVNREAGWRAARPALMRLVPHLSRTGIRPTELARRADVSKQAVGQTLRACEADGFVCFAPDPNDGRAQLVQLTAEGEAAVAYGQSVLGALESSLAERVGTPVIDRLCTTLATLLPVLSEWSENGAPSRTIPKAGPKPPKRPRR